jgi:transcriptional regulator with XRE-family HTH domain
MPRKPKTRTAVRLVREATGMTMKEFAAFLGLNLNTYQSLELGRLELGPERAYEIRRATGAKVFNPRATVVLDHENRPYTKKSFDKWHGPKSKRPDANATGQQRTQQLAGWIEVLMEAAERSGNLDAVFLRIAERVTAIREEFGLETETTKLLKARPMFTTYGGKGSGLTYGYLRDNPEVAKALGFKDDKAALRDDEIERPLEQKVIVPWSPEVLPVPTKPVASQKSR